MLPSLQPHHSFIRPTSVQAINDRKKKTEGEARKLDVVHKELEKIDLMLNTDVRFLRDSIEQASLDFMEAQ